MCIRDSLDIFPGLASNVQRLMAEDGHAADILLGPSPHPLRSGVISVSYTHLADFYKPDYDVKDWKEIKVPASWQTQGLSLIHI